MALITARSRALGLPVAESELEAFLPLSDAAYLVLLALETPRKLDRDFLEELDDGVRGRSLPHGALVEALDRLVELGLLEEMEGYERERHRLTGLGDAVLSAESGRRRRQFDVPTMPRLHLLKSSSSGSRRSA